MTSTIIIMLAKPRPAKSRCYVYLVSCCVSYLQNGSFVPSTDPSQWTETKSPFFTLRPLPWTIICFVTPSLTLITALITLVIFTRRWPRKFQGKIPCSSVAPHGVQAPTLTSSRTFRWVLWTPFCLLRSQKHRALLKGILHRRRWIFLHSIRRRKKNKRLFYEPTIFRKRVAC